jgi:hypothetical protein
MNSLSFMLSNDVLVPHCRKSPMLSAGSMLSQVPDCAQVRLFTASGQP